MTKFLYSILTSRLSFGHRILEESTRFGILARWFLLLVLKKMKKHNFFNDMLIIFWYLLVYLSFEFLESEYGGGRKTAFELEVCMFWQLEIWSMCANNFSLFLYCQAVLLRKDSSIVAD